MNTDTETRLRGGDAAAAGEFFQQHRDRLKRMVRLRLDRRLQGRLDASDVLQEAFLDVQKKAADLANKPDMPAYLWLRLVTAERLLILHRHHLGAQMRDAAQEVSLRGGMPNASTHSLANLLLGRLTSPSQAAVRAERQLRLQAALDGMDPIDREILALRHFEDLSNGEAAAVLGLSKPAACNRYVRAVKRLKEILSSLPDGSAVPSEL
jgi:RNA polymerase sigma-70 factor (ECF subfamily)